MNMSAFARYSALSVLGQADGSVYNLSSWLDDMFGFSSGPWQLNLRCQKFLIKM